MRKCCCDGFCCEPERVRRDGVIGSFCGGVSGAAFSLRARFDGVPFGVDILSNQEKKLFTFFVKNLAKLQIGAQMKN